MDYTAALAYIAQFIDYERSPDFARQARFYNLNRTTRLLDLIGNPHEKTKVIHVSGSKGKGSTAAIIASVLTHAGYKTGLYTSPHLITPRERCRIDNKFIAESEVAAYIDILKPAIETVSDSEFGRVSFFEIYTALAFTYFADKGTHFAVIEVGLGGRLDATNIVSPVATVMTPISLEHTAILGETYTDIAIEKAEIIKHACPLALAPQHPDADTVIKRVAKERNAPIVTVKNIAEKNTKALVLNSDGVPNAQQFDVQIGTTQYPQLTLPLLGHHQYINGTTAIAAIECLKQKGHEITKDNVYAGFRHVTWHGRMQVVKSSPCVVLDGAHSPVSMKALCRAIRENFHYTQVIFIVSFMKDKDLAAIGKIISKIADAVIVTQVPNNPRVMPAKRIHDTWSGICQTIKTYTSPREAITEGVSAASPTDLICVTGSLYLVGHALKFFNLADA